MRNYEIKENDYFDEIEFDEKTFFHIYHSQNIVTISTYSYKRGGWNTPGTSINVHESAKQPYANEEIAQVIARDVEGFIEKTFNGFRPSDDYAKESKSMDRKWRCLSDMFASADVNDKYFCYEVDETPARKENIRSLFCH